LGNENFGKEVWKIYPNPATDYLFIEVYETTDITIIDIMGKIVYKQVLLSGKNAVDLVTLSAGVYIIQSSGGRHAKFIKK
jgi:hypothetical protein